MEQYKPIFEKILSYEIGDLLVASDILEELTLIASKDETSLQEAAFLGELQEIFQKLVDLGVGPEAEDLKKEIAKMILGSLRDEEIDNKTEEAIQQSEEFKNFDSIAINDFEVLASFLSETTDHLDLVEEKILQLEKEFASHIVHEIFRAMHTIKGVSSFLGFQQIKTVSHELEFLLDDLRESHLEMKSELIDVLFEGRDFLVAQIKEIQQQTDLISENKKKTTFNINLQWVNIDPLIQQIKYQREGQGKPDAPKDSSSGSTMDEEVQSSFEDLLTPELVKKFQDETLDSLDNIEGVLLKVEKSSNPKGLIDEAFRNIHTIKGNAGFFGFLKIEQICQAFENKLDKVRNDELSISENLVSEFLGKIDTIQQMLNSISSSKQTQKESKPKENKEKKLQPNKPKSTPIDDTASNLEKYSIKKKDIRVDTAKLDNLFDLIGELITAEAMVFDNPEIKALEIDSFQRSVNYLSKITREIQNITMSIRMIPLDGLFGKMQRLVRDLSKKFGKPVEMKISGSETEMDRNIIEEISDPLVHIIRNSIDHGLEDPATRKRRKKTPEGLISLSAKYEGNEIWITVKDDGGGLATDKILKTATKRGLIDSEKAKTLKDEEIWNLVFEPGFSTAKEVSEISGRGVGMDVVKKNIEKLRGKIDVNSIPQLGTELTLKIPLTLAIIDAVIFRVNNMLYSLPIADVAEFQNFSTLEVSITGENNRVLKLREEVLPLIHLREVFHVGSETTNNTKNVMLVVKSNTKKLAVVVDEIVGYRQIVLKSLPEYMGNLPGISGCSLLGNGEVSLIVDVNELTRMVLG